MRSHDSVSGLVKGTAAAALMLACTLTGSAIAAGPADSSDAEAEYMVGVNLAGAEFAPHTLPGVEGQNFGWPSEARLDYWKSKGIRLIRLPFLWERLQPELMGDFDPTYLAGLKRSVEWMGERDMLVILDLHNYAHYRNRTTNQRKVIGSEEVPFEAFADVWRRLTTIFADNPAVYGYGLMNEPGTKQWLKTAQVGVDAIRAIDQDTRIYVANDYPGWAAQYVTKDHAAWAEERMPIPDPTMLKDPANKLRWELHVYMDHDASGTYRKSYQFEIERKDGPKVRVGPDIGVNRVRPFVAWLEKHNVKGLIGEYSVPAGPGFDDRWMVCLDHAMAYFRANNLPSTFWAAGEYWSRGHGWVIGPNGWKAGSPHEGEDRPQLKVLRKYVDSRDR